MTEDYKPLLTKLLGSAKVRYYPALAKYVGGATTALYLSQLLYWTFNEKEAWQDKLTANDGWFYIPVSQMEEQTGLTCNEQRTAQRNLIDKGLVEISYKGRSPRTTHFRVNLEALADLIKNDPIPSHVKSQSLEKSMIEKPDDQSYEKPMTKPMKSTSLVMGKTHDFNTENTDTTQKNKSEITDSAGKPAASPRSSGKKDSSSKADPRSKHPAILLIKGVTGNFPPKSLYDWIIQELGDCPNGELFAFCNREWDAHGFKPNNLSGKIEWYKQGGPPANLKRAPAPAADPMDYEPTPAQVEAQQIEIAKTERLFRLAQERKQQEAQGGARV